MNHIDTAPPKHTSRQGQADRQTWRITRRGLTRCLLGLLAIASLLAYFGCAVFEPAPFSPSGSHSWSRQPDLAAVFRQANPSVVTIKVQKRGEFAPIDDPHTLRGLRDLCGKDFEECMAVIEETAPLATVGTGFFIDQYGLTLTAAHVVADAERIHMRLANFQSVVAEVAGFDTRSDLAILKPLTAISTQPVRIGDSHRVAIGDTVVSIGAPFGLSGSLTVGLISGKDRRLTDQDEIPFIQSSVLVNPGSSGGPLFDRFGQVIAVTSRTLSAGGNFSGVSFSVPIELAMLVVDDLRSGRPLRRGRVGAIIADVPLELIEIMSLPDAKGALITAVDRDGPFDRSGIRAGDIVRAVNGVKLSHSGEFSRLMFEMSSTRIAQLELWRGGRSIMRDFSYGATMAGVK